MTDVALSISIAHAWSSIRETRDRIRALSAQHPADVRHAVMMAATELLENAVKYGEPVQGAPEVLFELRLESRFAGIKTHNGSRDPECVHRLELILGRIASAPDPASLYDDVIEQAARSAVIPTGGLGLYRIASEGHFSLSSRYRDEIVTIEARRSIE